MMMMTVKSLSLIELTEKNTAPLFFRPLVFIFTLDLISSTTVDIRSPIFAAIQEKKALGKQDEEDARSAFV